MSPSGVDDANREAALADQVQRIGRVAAVKDDLAARERPAARDREQRVQRLGGHVGEQLPFHDV